MTTTVDDVRDVMRRINALEPRVARLVNAPLPFDRVIANFPSVSATWLAPDIAQQQAIWNNTGGDFWLCRLSWAAWSTDPTVQGTTHAGIKLFDSGKGLSNAISAASVPVNVFDFVWNVMRRTSQASYVVPTGNMSGSPYLSRAALGNRDTGRVLEFRRPWCIPMGESLVFTIKPLGGNFGGSSSYVGDTRTTIHMLMDGFRAGGPK